jgi:hypothetical protein
MTRARGAVTVGRVKRPKTAKRCAEAQLSGGVPWGEIVLGSSSLYVCQKCGGEYHLADGCEPCAFCNDCKDDVLSILSEALLKAIAP